jgi:hypothetical protein
LVLAATKKALAKWAKREADLELRGIIAENHEWLERVGHWFYTQGAIYLMTAA